MFERVIMEQKQKSNIYFNPVFIFFKKNCGEYFMVELPTLFQVLKLIFIVDPFLVV